MGLRGWVHPGWFVPWDAWRAWQFGREVDALFEEGSTRRRPEAPRVLRPPPAPVNAAMMVGRPRTVEGVGNESWRRLPGDADADWFGSFRVYVESLVEAGVVRSAEWSGGEVCLVAVVIGADGREDSLGLRVESRLCPSARRRAVLGLVHKVRWLALLAVLRASDRVEVVEEAFVEREGVGRVPGVELRDGDRVLWVRAALDPQEKTRMVQGWLGVYGYTLVTPDSGPVVPLSLTDRALSLAEHGLVDC